MGEDGRTYDAAGVSLATATAVVERLRAAAESTGAQGFGQFAALHPLGDGRFLAASTDGVGTKLILARQRGALRACGADLAAHCINDVVTCGAEPLVLLDYVAAAQIDLTEVAELVEGAAEICRAAGRRAHRRRDGRAARHLPRRRARLRRHVRRRRRRRRSTAPRSRPATSSSAFPRRASTRTASRSCGACSRRRTTTGPISSRRRASISTPCARQPPPRARVRAHHGRRHPRQPRARPPRRPHGRDRLGLLAAPARVRLARAPRRRGRDAPRLQPRHRLLRRRPAGGAGRPRHRTRSR